ncbi:MAG: hypothetical protein ACRENE_16765 [Polyangiaceae bacterium]
MGREEGLKAALEWQKFEAWCTSNGLRHVPPSPEALGLIGLYITYLAATGRNIATVARALVRGKGTTP